MGYIIGARPRWFVTFVENEREAFQYFSRWDHPAGPFRRPQELVAALEETWQGRHAAIGRWNEDDWGRTWPGENDSEPEILTPQWIIWHLIEHDMHHTGEISFLIGAAGLEGLDL